MTQESGGKGNNEITWQTGNKGEKEPCYFLDPVPKGSQFSTTLTVTPTSMSLLIQYFLLQVSGKEDILASLTTLRLPHLQRVHLSPSLSHQSLSSCSTRWWWRAEFTLVRPSPCLGLHPISCPFFDRTLLSSPSPGSDFQISFRPQHWTRAQMREYCHSPLNIVILTLSSFSFLPPHLW